MEGFGRAHAPSQIAYEVGERALEVSRMSEDGVDGRYLLMEGAQMIAPSAAEVETVALSLVPAAQMPPMSGESTGDRWIRRPSLICQVSPGRG